ncbi:hypothetical protein HYFRA_00009905 [Hymenoscyphus fraxineus]|uniref:Uncharacterized protein n=1 Tax=Hymenoscyphus fraxineus TaxID=746836 RepID=A0A9N9L5R4_9HELO|nr:hypothetical protein HYFRA_00009905 [Hymenoscyphus fraxineus]
MPAIDPRLVQGVAEVAATIVRRAPLQGHEIAEAVVVILVSVFGVGGAIVYANKRM